MIIKWSDRLKDLYQKWVEANDETYSYGKRGDEYHEQYRKCLEKTGLAMDRFYAQLKIECPFYDPSWFTILDVALADIDSDCIDDIEKCWIWKGGFDENGRARLTDNYSRHGGKPAYAANVLQREVLNKRPIPIKNLGHVCGNLLCVNPYHFCRREMQERIQANRQEGWVFVP